jgi:hypothetical protein
MDSLFPALPEALAELSDDELQGLEDEHLQAARLIDADDEKFLEGLSGEQIIEQYQMGAEQVEQLRAEKATRLEAQEQYVSTKAEVASRFFPKAEAEGDEEEAEAEGEAEEAEGEAAEGEEEAAESEASAETEVEEPAADRELVLAAAETEANEKVKVTLRRPPAPAADRVVVTETKELSFVASGLVPTTTPGQKFESDEDIADAISRTARALGSPVHSVADPKVGEVKHIVASIDYRDNYPPERTLGRDGAENAEKIREIGSPYLGHRALDVLVASGGLCAPLTPIYSMPQLATDAEPVWDALPKFRANRGGINVPTPTTMGDATGAITIIEESDDALGGTFATKACLDVDCPDYTETAVGIIAACREFGNLLAMSWPEKIRHEMELTMAERARAAETRMLDRIKALSINVTNGAETLGGLIYVVDAITKSAFGMRSRLRLPREARFRAFLPAVTLDILLLDTIQNQLDTRYRTRGDIDSYLRSAGIEPVYYLDSPSTGTTQIADSAQTAAAIDPFPDNIQWAIHPEGTFLGLDMGELNLGIVRDSTLNSTNDFQIFSEVFRNVARIGPEQAAYWVTSDICAVGQFPPAGTARTCD